MSGSCSYFAFSCLCVSTMPHRHRMRSFVLRKKNYVNRFTKDALAPYNCEHSAHWWLLQATWSHNTHFTNIASKINSQKTSVQSSAFSLVVYCFFLLFITFYVNNILFAIFSLLVHMKIPNWTWRPLCARYPCVCVWMRMSERVSVSANKRADNSMKNCICVYGCARARTTTGERRS